MAEEPDLLTALCAAFAAGDPTVAYYLDRSRRGVVRVADGRADVQYVTAQEVEDDEDRFVEIPAVTVTDDFVWMQEFVEETDDPRIARLLDLKKGATKRFVKALPQAGPDAVDAWRVFRTGRLRSRAAEWLAEWLPERA